MEAYDMFSDFIAFLWYVVLGSLFIAYLYGWTKERKR